MMIQIIYNFLWSKHTSDMILFLRASPAVAPPRPKNNAILAFVGVFLAWGWASLVVSAPKANRQGINLKVQFPSTK